jgi:proline dehydrogenase
MSLLRGAVLRLTQNEWFQGLATRTPPGRAVASRFVAGEGLDDAMAVALRLRERGIAAILNHLGENVEAPEQAKAAADAYIESVRRIRAHPGLDCAVSVKLSQLGLDFSSALCLTELERVLEEAEEAGLLVEIDMESSAYVERTLAVFREVRTRHERVGVCLQAALRRTGADVFHLPERSRIRLVKGAYLEPPEVAYQRRQEVDRAFRRLFATLLARGHDVDVATHDEALIGGARRLMARRGVEPSRVEFQMLYGVRRDLQARLAAEGHPVRVYVPYGTEWYPYLTRRLAERPANLWFFVTSLVRR